HLAHRVGGVGRLLLGEHPLAFRFGALLLPLLVDDGGDDVRLDVLAAVGEGGVAARLVGGAHAVGAQRQHRHQVDAALGQPHVVGGFGDLLQSDPRGQVDVAEVVGDGGGLDEVHRATGGVARVLDHGAVDVPRPVAVHHGVQPQPVLEGGGQHV